MQKPTAIQPRVLNLDAAFSDLGPDESPYMRDVTDDINGNPVNTGQGMSNPTGEGQNFIPLTPCRSTLPIPTILPAGYNKNIGSAFCDITNELYYFNYNAILPGVYVLAGDTMQWSVIIEDASLAFTDDPKGFISDHRCRMRIVRDAKGNIIEKYLVITDGINWQKWFMVNAMIQTKGFNASLYPYFTLLQPHFDRKELFEMAPRPCMQKPTITAVPYSPANTGLINRVIDKSFQFCLAYQYTDGRQTVFGVYSNPFIVKSEIFLNNPNYLPKQGIVTGYAGSCMIEKILIYVRQCSGNWALYDTIYKYPNSQTDSSNIIGTPFWTRSNPWSLYNYDPVFNTIQYTFDFSKASTIVDQADAVRLQNDLPQISIGMTDGGDALILANNRYNYNNFDPATMAKFALSAVEQPTTGCPIPNRTIRLYAYIGRPGDRLSWESQVGYFNGADTQFRFGGLQLGPGTVAEVNIPESKYFDLDFDDQEAFRCYLKGTPYYSDGTWYIVNANNSIVQVSGTLDFSNNDVLTQVQNVFLSGGYYVCVFDFEVPAGRYIAAIGRHNVSSAGDFINTSTYVLGLANSRSKVTGLFTNNQLPLTYLSPFVSGTITTYEKEQEIDCTGGDVDVWGNGHDLFYIFCPFESTRGYRFIEGYFQESQSNPLGVEKFPYTMTEGANTVGEYTDKNGFYWGFYAGPHADVCDIYFNVKLNCIYPINFNIQTSQSGAGYRVNSPAYITDHNNGVVGDCNRILVAITIKSLDGAIPYSNIAVSIVGGATVFTNSNGKATLIVHNGLSGERVNNIYINAAGNFLITISDCGYLAVYPFNSALAPCTVCNIRNYPIPINLNINVQTFETTSVKEGGSYNVGVYGADLAGRLMPVNVAGILNVPTFMQRDDTSPMSVVAEIAAALQLNKNYPGIAYLFFCISKDQTKKSWLQWVGDSIQYVDNNGNVVSNASSAVFCSIAITSLYNANVAKNFSTIANYQFSSGDRVRIIDDGNGNLLDTAQFGDPIDLLILGNNYNQAAVTANLLPNPSLTPVVNVSNQVTNNNTINTSTGTTSTTSVETQQNNQAITLYVAYDSRLDALIKSTGFWIEIYTPTQVSDEIPYCETNVYPVINGEVAQFQGVEAGNPVFNFPTTIILDFWDTYFISRNITIPLVGSKFFPHPFESPNISDTFGPYCSSCGRQNFKNDNVKQQFYPLDVIKGDDYVSEGVLNGLANFRDANRKSFAQGYLWGGIVACYTQGSVILFICENNSFATNFNFQYVFANNQGIQVANLDNQISDPMQKIARGYGAAMEHTSSIVFFDRYCFFYDYKNEAFVLDDYRTGQDISKLMVKSYFKAKTQFVEAWNNGVSSNASLFDVITGVDGVNDKVYVTFRARQNNSNNVLSYTNNKRNVQLNASETIVYDIIKQRWRRFAGLTPEGYGVLKGKNSGLQMIPFAAGKPYQTNTGNANFSNYFGQQVTPVIIGVFNDQKSIPKLLANLSQDIHPFALYVDMIYSEERWSYSYIPVNRFKRRMNQWYAAVLRNMSSFKNPDPSQAFRSTLHDGKRTVGKYFVVRFVVPEENAGQYFQLSTLFALFIGTHPIKK